MALSLVVPDGEQAICQGDHTGSDKCTDQPVDFSLGVCWKNRHFWFMGGIIATALNDRKIRTHAYGVMAKDRPRCEAGAQSERGAAMAGLR